MYQQDRFLPPYSSAEDVCPICKSDRYLNPGMKLLVPPCYHKMCESCIDRLFSLGPAPCPVCQRILRKTNFWTQRFEDLKVERELQVRKRIARNFNKRPGDFKDVRQYNDYLEEVEDITFNLVNGIDVEETEERIQKFALENRDSIAANLARAQREERMFNYRLEQEKADKEVQRQMYLQQLEKEELARTSEKSSIINQLATSNQAARDILAQRAITLKRSSMRRQQEESSSHSFRSHDSALQDHSWMDQAHDDDFMDVDGEEFSPLDDQYGPVDGFTLRTDYYDPISNSLQNVQVLISGGYSATFAHERALEAAFTGLTIAPLTGLSPNPEAAEPQ